ncbi:MAG: hypothetical protein WCP28_21665, partial [Actinomycetes bacterium]
MSSDARRYLRYLRSERDAGRMYRALAQLADGERAEALTELAEIEDRHAAHWESKLREAGQPIPEDPGQLEPGSAALVDRARRSSLGSVLPDLEAAERQAQGDYDDEPDALPGMAADEHRHAQVLHDMQDGVETSDPTSVSSPDAAGPSGPAHDR